jgi:integrase
MLRIQERSQLPVAHQSDFGRSTHDASPQPRHRWELATPRITAEEASKLTGGWVDPALGRMTFAEWVERWLRFGRWPLSRIRSADVRAMVAEEMAAGNLSPSAVRRHAIVLDTILEVAVADGRLARNPVRGMKLPAETSRRMRFLEPQEVVRLAEAHPEHYRPLILTAAYMGLRWGELVGLPVSNVNLLKREITVDRQLVEIASGVSFGPPKTRAGIRTVRLPSTLADVLGRHFASPAVQSSGLAFPGPKGAPLRRSNFRRVWSKATARAGLEGLRFHELRHTAVALAVAQGAHPLAIKERLGHSSITVTMDTYGRLFPRLEEAIAEGLDRMLKETAAGPLRDESGTTAHLSRSAG